MDIFASVANFSQSYMLHPPRLPIKQSCTAFGCFHRFKHCIETLAYSGKKLGDKQIELESLETESEQVRKLTVLVKRYNVG